jgi:hypothetical protein
VNLGFQKILIPWLRSGYRFFFPTAVYR